MIHGRTHHRHIGTRHFDDLTHVSDSLAVSPLPRWEGSPAEAQQGEGSARAGGHAPTLAPLPDPHLPAAAISALDLAMRLLQAATILHDRPDAEIVIVGADGTQYSFGQYSFG